MQRVFNADGGAGSFGFHDIHEQFQLNTVSL